MKKIFLLMFLPCAAFYYSQTGKIGIETQNPTETIHINGTARIGDLPLDGTPNALYGGGVTKTQAFNATKTLVTDDSGNVGYVTGLPITVDPNVKSLQYAVNTVIIDDNCPTSSITTIGNLAVRFNATSSSSAGSFVEISVKSPSVYVGTSNVNGSGGQNLARYKKINAGTNSSWGTANGSWYKLTAYSMTIGNFDTYAGYVNLYTLQESYRVTVLMNPAQTAQAAQAAEVGGSATQNTVPALLRQVTIFVELLK